MDGWDYEGGTYALIPISTGATSPFCCKIVACEGSSSAACWITTVPYVYYLNRNAVKSFGLSCSWNVYLQRTANGWQWSGTILRMDTPIATSCIQPKRKKRRKCPCRITTKPLQLQWMMWLKIDMIIAGDTKNG